MLLFLNFRNNRVAGMGFCLSSAGRFDTQHHSRDVMQRERLHCKPEMSLSILSGSSFPGGSWDLAMGMEGQEYPPGKRQRERERMMDMSPAQVITL